MHLRRLVLAALVMAQPAAAQVQVASLGQCPLELGGVIHDCRLAYRTFGTYDAAKRNAILIPTWFASRVDESLPLLGPRGVVDTTEFFVVIVESLGAGRSSSPTLSQSQRGVAFPEITIGDMVAASYRLTHDVLRLPDLHAVVGHSMGGMQAFEWGVAYPDYVRRIVPISGNPKQWTHGLSMWELIGGAADDGARGRLPRDSALLVLSRFLNIAGSTPQRVNRQAPTNYAADLKRQADGLASIDLFEWAWHARAILRHDISRRFGGDVTRAGQAWKAPSLVVVAAHDHSVDPEPALAFARLIRADTIVMPSPAGHGAIFADTAARAAIRRFLAR